MYRILAACLLCVAMCATVDAAPPAAPTVSGVSLGWFNGRIYLTNPATDADTFNIYVKPVGGPTWTLHAIDVPQNGPLDVLYGVYVAGLNQLTSYDFAISGVNEDGEGDLSNTVTGTTKRKPNTE